MRRLICTFVVRIWHKQVFSWGSSNETCSWSFIWAAPSEFVSSSIPSWQTLTAHAQPFRGARDLAFCLKVPLDSLLVWASSEGSGETARMRRLAWTFAARIGDKYQIRLARPICFVCDLTVQPTMLQSCWPKGEVQYLTTYPDFWQFSYTFNTYTWSQFA